MSAHTCLAPQASTEDPRLQLGSQTCNVSPQFGAEMKQLSDPGVVLGQFSQGRREANA